MWLQGAQAQTHRLPVWLKAKSKKKAKAGQLRPLCRERTLRRAGQHRASSGRDEPACLGGFCFPLVQVSTNRLAFLTAPLCHPPCMNTLPAQSIRLCSLMYYFLQRCNPQPRTRYGAALKRYLHASQHQPPSSSQGARPRLAQRTNPGKSLAAFLAEWQQ